MEVRLYVLRQRVNSLRVGGRVNSQAGTEVAIDVEFDGRCESMEGRGAWSFVPHVERNFIGAKSFVVEMAIVPRCLMIKRHGYITM